jgi:hypothetical protein
MNKREQLKLVKRSNRIAGFWLSIMPLERFDALCEHKRKSRMNLDQQAWFTLKP